MRILCVTHAYPRWDGDVAGAFIERLNVALAARGHAVSVIAPADEGRGGFDTRYGISVHRTRYAAPERETLAYRGTLVQAARSPAGFAGAIGLVRALRRAVRTAPPVDVIHAHWWIPGGLAVWAARRATPFVVTLHGTDVALLRQMLPARMLARRVLGRAAAITAVSSFLADRVRHTGIPVSSVLPMPAEVERFTRESNGGGGIVTLGRLSGQKRLDLLLEAMAIARRTRPDLTLRVVGEGPERQRLESEVHRCGIADATSFVGAVAPAAVAEAIGDADVFAFPAVGEGYGLAAAEALMLGVPVVALEDGGGVLDIVREAAASGAARIVRPNDPAVLAEALVAMATDPSARGRAREAGAVLREALSPATVAERYERVLASVVRERADAAS